MSTGDGRDMISMKELAPANVRAIAPYVPGKPISETARELGIPEARILKMASNENPLGPSPAALAAIRGALADLNYYPDGSGYDLKRVLSRKLAVAPENLVLGNGSNDVLELVARAFLRPTESAVYSRHAFMVYPLVVQAIGAAAIEVPAREYGNDLDALAAAVRGDTKIVFLANPNNPTGTFSPWGEIEEVIRHSAEAAATVRSWPGERFALFLEDYAMRIEGRAAEIIAIAHRETGLAVEPRLKTAELPRTVNQLRQAAT